MKLCCEVTSLQKYSFRNKKPDTDPTNSTTLETNTRMKRYIVTKRKMHFKEEEGEIGLLIYNRLCMKQHQEIKDLLH